MGRLLEHFWLSCCLTTKQPVIPKPGLPLVVTACLDEYASKSLDLPGSFISTTAMYVLKHVTHSCTVVIPFFSLLFSPQTRSLSVGSGSPSLVARRESSSINCFCQIFSATFAGTGGIFLLTTTACAPPVACSSCSRVPIRISGDNTETDAGVAAAAVVAALDEIRGTAPAIKLVDGSSPALMPTCLQCNNVCSFWCK